LRSSILLRVASLISLLYFAGHTSGRPWTPSKGAETDALVGMMKSYRFEVLGSSRTYWDFYQGFGLAISVHLLVQTVVLWELGRMARTDPSRVRSLIAVFGVALLANAFLAWKFFFAPPAAFAIAIAACLWLAFFFARPKPAA